MRWTLVDGSPRGKRSNTAFLLEALARGLEAAGHATELLHLALPAEADAAPERFAAAERVVLGFPLYTDAMPGQVMEFIERLEPFQGRPSSPPVAFLIQSGFPEPGQSRAVERYLELLAARLGSRYLGTIVKGGGMSARTPAAARWVRALEELGRDLGQADHLDPGRLRRFAGPDWFEGWRALVLRLVLRFRANPKFDQFLAKNGAFERRYDRPYAAAAPDAELEKLEKASA
jgi:NAD(P)H-dependent FMN reductase